MSSCDDSTSAMTSDLTSEGLVESLRSSADPADRAVAELFRSAKEVFGSGPAPEIGEALARFTGATTTAPGSVATTVGSRIRWLPNTAAKVLLGVALAAGSLTTAYAAGVVDFGFLFDRGGDPVPVPVSEPSAPPTFGPSSTVSIDPESVAPDTMEIEQQEPVTTVPVTTVPVTTVPVTTVPVTTVPVTTVPVTTVPVEPVEPVESVEPAEPAEAGSALDAGAEPASTVPERRR